MTRAYLFEAWWPGIRAQAWVEGGRLVRLRAEGLADALVAFGELSDELPERLLEDGVLLDGWLLALDEGGWLDTELLRRRLSGDRSAGRPAYVASDLLWTGGDDWQRRTVLGATQAAGGDPARRRPLRRLPRAARRGHAPR